MTPATLQSWISDNANLLSGLAGIVTLASIAAAPLIQRWTRAAHAGGPGKATEIPPARPLRLPAARSGPGGIAVMPFDSVSGDPHDGHLADGLSCEIISALGRAGYRHIVPRADSFALRAKGLSLAEIGERLAVRYIVHGSVRHSVGRLRVIAELADSGTGRQLWSKTYDRELADILLVQEEIAQAIAASLGGETLRAEVLNLPPNTSDTSAWALVQRARHIYLTSTGQDSVLRALARARKALEIDPRYALAHALVAQLLMDSTLSATPRDADKARAEARAAIEQALALASRDPEILMFAGRVWIELGERERSVAALRSGTELAPQDVMQWGWLSRSLAFGSRTDAEEAVAIARRIIEMTPEHPSVWTWQLFQGLALMNLERYQEALPLLRQAVETSPRFVRALMAFAAALGACGRNEEAAEIIARAHSINPQQDPQRFRRYVATLANSDETAARMTLGLTEAGLLPA